MKLKLSSIVLMSIILAGCVTHRVGGYTLMSSKNVNLNTGKLMTTMERVREVHTNLNYARFDEATDRTIQTNKCAVALSDVETYAKPSFITVTAIVEGNLVIDRNLPGCAAK
ncbi:hypothetical protein ACFQ02_02610 [Seminibacterium arietis]|uniref:Lipoprotein n=1 Tax=Seminibacterium arietis TaxID=1173502 RepID=A0ABW3I8L6_9PAST